MVSKPTLIYLEGPILCKWRCLYLGEENHPSLVVHIFHYLIPRDQLWMPPSRATEVVVAELPKAFPPGSEAFPLPYDSETPPRTYGKLLEIRVPSLRVPINFIDNTSCVCVCVCVYIYICIYVYIYIYMYTWLCLRMGYTLK